MATILDIAGKPMPPRRQKNRARADDMRDLSKILMVLFLIVLGFFTFAPETAEGTDEAVVTASAKASG